MTMRLRCVRVAVAVILLHGGIIGIIHGENDVSQRVSLTGADWRIHEDADGKGVERGMPQADPSGIGWIPANVPGNIQADVEAARLIKPISYGADRVEKQPDPAGCLQCGLFLTKLGENAFCAHASHQDPSKSTLGCVDGSGAPGRRARRVGGFH